MNFKIFAFRTANRAELWCLSFLPLIVFGTMGAFAFAFFSIDPWWVPVALLLPMFGWTTRLRLTRQEPKVVTFTSFCLIIPFRWRREDLDGLATDLHSPFDAHDGEEDDEIVLVTPSGGVGDEIFSCSRANRVLAWLKESSTLLSTPLAEARRSD